MLHPAIPLPNHHTMSQPFLKKKKKHSIPTIHIIAKQFTETESQLHSIKIFTLKLLVNVTNNYTQKKYK